MDRCCIINMHCYFGNYEIGCHISLCVALWDQISFMWGTLCRSLHWWRSLAHSDAEINRRAQCRTVCWLIFRGDPCIILGSDILSVSMSAPRYPSEMKNPDTVPCNSALNPGHWGFSITPQMEWMPLHTAKTRQHYLSSRRCFMPAESEHFCSVSLIWNHITAACQDGCFWSSEVKFFPSEVHLHGCLCSFTGDFCSLLSVIITSRLASENTSFTAALFVTTENGPVFPKCH